MKVIFDETQSNRITCHESKLTPGWYRGRLRGFEDAVFMACPFMGFVVVWTEDNATGEIRIIPVVTNPNSGDTVDVLPVEVEVHVK